VPSKLMRLLVLSLTPIWTLSCGTPLVQVGSAASPAPLEVNVTVASSCSWEAPFYPDAGFETRLTRNEKVWIVAHNAKVAEFCPQAPAK
jgi:hypothetical protein